jgi:hypothetical protein
LAAGVRTPRALFEFGLQRSPDKRELCRRVATDVAFTIQALRDSVSDAIDDNERAEMRRRAKELRSLAVESLNRLEKAL